MKKDILPLLLSAERENDSLELSPNITAELNESGEPIGIEILNLSAFVRGTSLDINFGKVSIVSMFFDKFFQTC